MIAKVFFTAIAQPHPQHLRHLLLLRLIQALIQRHGLLTLAPARPVFVGIPQHPRCPDATTGLLHQRTSCERCRVFFLLRRHTQDQSYATPTPFATPKPPQADRLQLN